MTSTSNQITGGDFSTGDAPSNSLPGSPIPNLSDAIPILDGSGVCLNCGGEPIEGNPDDGTEDVAPGTRLQLTIPAWACNLPEFRVVADFGNQISFFDPCVEKQISLNPFTDGSVRIAVSSLVLLENYVFSRVILSAPQVPSTEQPETPEPAASSFSLNPPSAVPRVACRVQDILVGNTIVKGFALFYTSQSEFSGATYGQEIDFNDDTFLRFRVQTLSPQIGESGDLLTVDTPGFTVSIDKNRPKENSVFTEKASGAKQSIWCGINF